MRLHPRPILSEAELEQMERRATPALESTRRLFERYRACASDVRKAVREADHDGYIDATKRLETLRCQIDWDLSNLHRPLHIRQAQR